MALEERSGAGGRDWASASTSASSAKFIFVKQDDDGALAVPNPDDNLEKSCYDVSAFSTFHVARQNRHHASTISAGTCIRFDHEDANAQFEFDFKYADALTMCDRYIFFRFMAKHYAAEEGLLATFMPKPFADKTGNGAHFNMSLYDLKTGGNLFKPAIRKTIRAGSV